MQRIKEDMDPYSIYGMDAKEEDGTLWDPLGPSGRDELDSRWSDPAPAGVGNCPKMKEWP